MSRVVFNQANLYKANFSRAIVTGCQLESALSTQGTVAPNRTILEPKNLIYNGYADCEIPLNGSWILKTGFVSTNVSIDDPKNCHFVLKSHNTTASIFQRINLSTYWNPKRWSYSQVVLRAKMSSEVLAEMRAIDTNGSVIARIALSRFHSITTSLYASIIYRSKSNESLHDFVR